MYEIAAATAVKIIIDYLGRHLAPGRPETAAAARLYDLVREHVPHAAAWQRLVHESVTGSLQQSTVTGAEQALADVLDADAGFAGQLQDLIRRSGRDPGPPPVHTSVRVEQQNKFSGAVAGRDIVDKSKVVTRIAIGGGSGAILAAVLLFVWHSYSAADEKSSDLKAYRGAVVSTCDRIRTTGTGDLTPHVNSGGIYFLRSEILTSLNTNRQVVREQTAALLEKPAPDQLAAEKSEVAKAAATVDGAYPDASARVKRLPSSISLERMQKFAEESAMTDLTQSYRHLGDALTRLAGSTCVIEAPATTK